MLRPAIKLKILKALSEDLSTAIVEYDLIQVVKSSNSIQLTILSLADKPKRYDVTFIRSKDQWKFIVNKPYKKEFNVIDDLYQDISEWAKDKEVA